MNSKRKPALTLQLGLTALACACLMACGGATTAPQLSGVAAYGAPMANAKITLIDAVGTTKETTADSTGSYTLDVTGLTAPFLIKASMPSGDSVKEYASLVMTAPKAGDTGIANVTPLTHALVSMVSSDGTNPNEFATVDNLKTVDANKLASALKNLQAALAEVLKDAGLPETFDPVTTVFKADRASASDVLLDTIKVSLSDQGVSLTNARASVASDDPNSTPAAITIKGVPAAAPTPLAKSNVAADDIKGLDGLVTDANACLALAPSARVSKDALGTYTFLSACANVAGFASDYKAYGYSLQELWGPRLLEQIPADSKLLTPEFLLFLDNGNKALVRLAFSSPNGGKVYFEVAEKTANGWKIRGNQRDYDASVSVRIYRQNDLSTNGWTTPSSYVNSSDAGKNIGKFDAYTSRLNFAFNQTGPNGANVYAVRVTGPGLPATGIVLSRSSACGTDNYLGFYSNNGALPMLSVTNSNLTTTSATNSWVLDVAPFGKTYTGTDFYNQYRGLTSTGLESSSTSNNVAKKGTVNLAQIPEFALYKWEVFTTTSGATAAATLTSRIITRPLAASEGSKQAWATLTPDALDYLNPNNAVKAGELTSGQLSWTLPNASAPAVVSGYIYGSNSLGRMNMGQSVNKLGDTSLSFTAEAEKDGNGKACSYAKVPAFTSTKDYREVGLRQVTDRGLMLSQYSYHTGRAAP